ncbi:hypothetical protein [Streptomyces sp. NPDC057838]|uniref:hypothetical protein n=1 Tax=unclassified Streptomyces TaxID=2593676 RepID=UPI0036CBDCD7
MDQRTRRVGAVATAVVAAVTVLAGCSDEAAPGGEGKTSASSSPAAGAGETGAAAPASGVDRSTAEKAVAGWVAAVIKGDAGEACLLMAEPAAGSGPARVGSEETCGDDAPQRKRLEQTLGQFKESFTPDPPSDAPEVEVARTPATGQKVTVPADRITVDGQGLDEIVLSHSTGVTEDQLDIKVESSRIEDSWYVTNLHFDIG